MNLGGIFGREFAIGPVRVKREEQGRSVLRVADQVIRDAVGRMPLALGDEVFLPGGRR